MRSFVLIFLAGVLTGDPAAAQSRPNLLVGTCAAARQLVGVAGAIVVDTGAFTFERIVTSAEFCDRRETLIPHWTRTRDQVQCPVGFRCGSTVSSNSR